VGANIIAGFVHPSLCDLYSRPQMQGAAIQRISVPKNVRGFPQLPELKVHAA
jgi:hypothetical protein